jgi:SAM-dependent methyltransferase
VFGLTTRRDVAAEARPEGGGVESFDTEAALEINRARLEHLTSLGLPLEGRRVLEVGAGVGWLTGFFLDRGCSVVATEARSENVAELRRRLPTVKAHETDVEESLEHLGSFDVVFCYGLPYHLESPLRALRNIAAVCQDLLLIETIVCDARIAALRLEDETTSVNPALRGLAHRPSPSYLALALNRVGFDHTRRANRPSIRTTGSPRLTTWTLLVTGRCCEACSIASRTPLEQPTLTSLLG